MPNAFSIILFSQLLFLHQRKQLIINHTPFYNGKTACIPLFLRTRLSIPHRNPLLFNPNFFEKFNDG
jgi:hypothetical protein